MIQYNVFALFGRASGLIAGAMKRLEKDYGAERLNMACARAIEINADSSSVRSILRAGLDHKNAEAGIQEAAFDHDNVRGPDYYH